jgi:hypothetical protein
LLDIVLRRHAGDCRRLEWRFRKLRSEKRQA